MFGRGCPSSQRLLPLQAAAAQLQIAKMEREAFDTALKIIRTSQPPAVNVGALGVKNTPTTP